MMVCKTIYHNFIGSNPDPNYGKVMKDTHWVIRGKLLGLSLVTVPYVGARIILRTGALLTGDFVRSGLELAERRWELEMQDFRLGYGATTPNLRTIRAKEISKELILNICKIVTLPFAIIGLVFSAITGVFFPYQGRAMYGAIEHAWSRNVDNPIPGFDYLAICMQPDRVHEDKFYGQWSNLGRDTKRQFHKAYYDLRRYVLRRQEFFEKENVFQLLEELPKSIKDVPCTLEDIAELQRLFQGIFAERVLANNVSIVQNGEDDEQEPAIADLKRQLRELVERIKEKASSSNLQQQELNTDSASDEDPSQGQPVHIDNDDD